MAAGSPNIDFKQLQTQAGDSTAAATIETSQGFVGQTEQELAALESELGAPGQQDLQANPATPYSGRYNLNLSTWTSLPDPAALGNWAAQYNPGLPATPANMTWAGKAGLTLGPDNKIPNPDYVSLAQNITKTANSMLDQAQKAAEAGNMDEAKRLKAQAQSYIDAHTPGGSLASLYKSSLTLGGPDPSMAATDLAASPSAKAVGALISEGRDLLNPDSPGYNRFFTDLTSGAVASARAGLETGERSIASQARGAERSIMEAQAGGGYGRDLMADQALVEQEQAGLATERANLETQEGATEANIVSNAKQFMDQFGTKLAASSVELGQAWAQNEPGVRDSYTKMVLGLNDTLATFEENIGKQGVELSQFSQQQQFASQSRSQGIVTGGTSTLASLVTAVVTAIGTAYAA